MVLATINNNTVTFDSMTDFLSAIWSPGNQYSFVTDFRVHGDDYAQKKENARNLAKSVQAACSNGNFTWSDTAYIGAAMDKIARRYGLVREFKENGII